MTTSLPFQQQFTWRKLGYLFFADSLAYREVLEQNPQWRVNELPPLGVQLRIGSNGNPTSGLSQGGFVFGLPSSNTSDIFPFDTEKEYVQALVKYSAVAVTNRDQINGWSLDSEVITRGG
jgi:hypothetical protein